MIQFTIQLGRTQSLWLYYHYHLTPILLYFILTLWMPGIWAFTYR